MKKPLIIILGALALLALPAVAYGHGNTQASLSHQYNHVSYQGDVWVCNNGSGGTCYTPGYSWSLWHSYRMWRISAQGCDMVSYIANVGLPNDDAVNDYRDDFVGIDGECIPNNRWRSVPGANTSCSIQLVSYEGQSYTRMVGGTPVGPAEFGASGDYTYCVPGEGFLAPGQEVNALATTRARPLTGTTNDRLIARYTHCTQGTCSRWDSPMIYERNVQQNLNGGGSTFIDIPVMPWTTDPPGAVSIRK